MNMSEREQAKQIINKLSDYKVSKLLVFLKGIEFDAEFEELFNCKGVL